MNSEYEKIMKGCHRASSQVKYMWKNNNNNNNCFKYGIQVF